MAGTHDNNQSARGQEQKAESYRQKQTRTRNKLWTLKGCSQWCTSSSKAAFPKPPQNSTTNWDQAFKCLRLWWTVKASFTSSPHKLVIWEELSIGKMPPQYKAVGKLVGHFLRGDWCERAYSFVGTIPEMVLGALRKQAEQTMRNKPVSSPCPWPLHQLLSPGSCPDFTSRRTRTKTCKLK